MPQCQWKKTDRAGKQVAGCIVMAQEDSSFCPRHSFLFNVENEQKRQKLARRVAADAAGVKGVLPQTRGMLLAKGYVFEGAKECGGCGARIEMWRTPNLKSAPFDPMPFDSSFARSHFATCENAAAYRRAS